MKKSVFLIIVILLLGFVSSLPFPKAQVSYLKTFEQDGTFLKIPTISMADSVISYRETKELYQFNITLAKPPPTNVFTFPIETSGLEFRYQPPLNEELDLKLYDFVNATDAIGKTETLHRPLNVVGSYAVYKTVRGLGRNKLYHIYRPLVIDAKGSQIWANLSITKSQMQITIDVEWLTNAVYPVVIDPSFGKTDVGGSTWNSAYAIGSRYTLSETGTVTDLTFYANTASVSCFVAVYDVDGSNDPLNLQTNNSDTTASGWTNVDVADVELSAGEYYLFMEANAGLRYDSGTEAHYNEWLGYWEDPYVSDGDVARDYSIYANYTTGGAPTEYTEYGSATLAYADSHFNGWLFDRTGTQAVAFQSGQQREVGFSVVGAGTAAFASGFLKALLMSRFGSGTVAFNVNGVASFLGLTVYAFYGSAAFALSSGHFNTWVFSTIGGVAVSFASGVGRAVAFLALGDATLAYAVDGFATFLSHVLTFYGSAAITFLADSFMSYTTVGLYFYGSAALGFIVNHALSGLELLQRLGLAETTADAALAFAILGFCVAVAAVGIAAQRKRKKEEE